MFDDLVRFVRASYVETDDERMARMNKVCVGSCIGRTLTARRYQLFERRNDRLLCEFALRPQERPQLKYVTCQQKALDNKTRFSDFGSPNWSHELVVFQGEYYNASAVVAKKKYVQQSFRTIV